MSKDAVSALGWTSLPSTNHKLIDRITWTAHITALVCHCALLFIQIHHLTCVVLNYTLYTHIWFPMVMNWLFRQIPKKQNRWKNKAGYRPEPWYHSNNNRVYPDTPSTMQSVGPVHTVGSCFLYFKRQAVHLLCSPLSPPLHRLAGLPPVPRADQRLAGLPRESYDPGWVLGSNTWREKAAHPRKLARPLSLSLFSSLFSLSFPPTRGVWVSLKFRACCVCPLGILKQILQGVQPMLC
jgi:hypothetical protein